MHHIIDTWEKVSILATGCRRQGLKIDAKSQKTTQKGQNWLKDRDKTTQKFSRYKNFPGMIHIYCF